MELRRLLEILWQRKWYVIQAIIFLPMLTILAAYLITPSYETKAKLLIKEPEVSSALLSTLELKSSSTSQSGTAIENYLDLTSVNAIYERMIYKLQLRDDQGNLHKPSDLQDKKFIISTIFPAPFIETEAVEDAEIINITATATDPEEAAMMANSFAEEYIAEELARRKEKYQKAKTILQNQILQTKAAFLTALDELREFRVNEKTLDLDTEIKAGIDKLGDLLSDKEKAIISIAETTKKLDTLNNQFKSRVVSSVPLSENPQIENLKKKLTELQLQMEASSLDKTEKHPDVVAIKKQINTVTRELRQEMEMFQQSSRELQEMERDLAASKARLANVNQAIDEHLKKLYEIPNKARTNAQLQIRQQTSSDLYKTLLQYMDRIAVVETMPFSDIQLVQQAEAPDQDDTAGPGKKVLAILATILGTITGLALAFTVEYLDDAVHIPDDIVMDDAVLLGSVPKYKNKNRDLLISRKRPTDPVYESYRSVRNCLNFIVKQPVKSIVISSCWDNEGKSVTAANIAISATRENKKILLIDADYRNPKIGRLFEVPDRIGLADVVKGGANLEQAVLPSGTPGLDLLLGGKIPPDPGEILESASFQHLIGQLGQSYDHIIVDSPAIFTTSDALAAAGSVDLMIIVVESGKTTRRALAQLNRLLRLARVEPVGIVLNKLKKSSGKGYYAY